MFIQFSRPARATFFVVFCLSVLLPHSIVGQQLDPSLYSGLRWRMIGPFRGGRTVAVSGIENQPNVYY
ncbi:MAG TPA: hypothetical protein VNV88_13950, partial [Candidatus Solibacter sp.]|nr:hypothetical protein [Candidatus Solibacter sp.]